MNVALQGDGRVGVPQQFAECFDVTARLQAQRGKGVPQSVRMHRRYLRAEKIHADAPAEIARFGRFLGASGEHPGGVRQRFADRLKQAAQPGGQRKLAQRVLRFRGLNGQPGAAARQNNALHRALDR